MPLPDHIVAINDLGSEGSWDNDDLWSYDVKLSVQTDSPTYGPKFVIASLGLWAASSYAWPMTTTATETNAAARLKRVQARSTSDDRMQWEVSLEYGLWSSEGDPRGQVDGDGNRNPTTAYPTLVCRGDSEDFAVTLDRSGDPILNSAGDPFDPPLTRPVPYRVYEVGWYSTTFDDSLVEALQGHVNDDTWMDFAAGSVLCKTLTASCDWSADLDDWIWTLRAELAIRKPIQVSSKTVLPGWTVEVLDCGTRELDGSDRKQILIDNAPVSSPVPLDGSGAALDPSDPPVYLAFDVYPEADFSVLGFPSDLFTRGV